MRILARGGRRVIGVLVALGIGAGLAGAAQARETVAFAGAYPAGMIIIKQSQRALYLTEGNGIAIRYPVAIGMSGRAWRGEAYVDGKYVAPAWAPPAVVRAAHPSIPSLIPGGAPNNPMGAAALTLNLPEIAIHGTTRRMRKSVGTAASFGCIRMYNEDVVDLYSRVQVGTRVIAIP